MSKYELAIDSDGEPFDVPPHITGWRLRRLHPDGRGRPELVYDATGRPVILPADATFLELRDVAGAGRYRLDPVDASGHVDAAVTTGCTGHVQGHDGIRNSAVTGERAKGQPRMDYEDLLVESMRANIRLAEMVIEKIPAILAASGGLLTAADNAGLTTRTPPLAAPPAPPPPEPMPEDDDEAQEEPPPPTGSNWIATLLATLGPHLPAVIEKLAKSGPSLLGGLPLAALLDWRKAVPGAMASSESPSATTPAASAPAGAPSPADVSPVPSATNYAHVVQVYQQLTSAERERAEAINARLSPAERAAFLAELSKLSVPDALAWVRDRLHRQPSPGNRQRPTPHRQPVAAPTAEPVAAPSVPKAASIPARHSPAPSIAPTPTLHAAPTPAPAPSSTSPEPMSDASSPRVEPSMGPDERMLHAHLLAIWNALSPDERGQAEQLVNTLSADQRTAWISELASMPVLQATAWIRALLQSLQSSQPPPTPALAIGSASSPTTNGVS